MTESGWLASEDPAAMLKYALGHPDGLPGNSALPRKVSDRKLRLFACACARAMGLTRRAAAELILPAELLADGDRSRVPLAQRPAMPGVEWCYAEAGEGARRWAKYASLVAKPHRAHLLREIVGNPFRPMLPAAQVRWVGDLCYRLDNGLLADGIHPDWLTPTVVMLARTTYEERIDASEVEAVAAQPDRTPDSRPAVAGQPRAGGRLGPQQLVTGTLDPFRLAVLSDALEEAGCDDEAILRHLRGQTWRRLRCSDCGGELVRQRMKGLPDLSRCARQVCGLTHGPFWQLVLDGEWVDSPGPHVRGCHVIDLLLGKE